MTTIRRLLSAALAAVALIGMAQGAMAQGERGSLETQQQLEKLRKLLQRGGQPGAVTAEEQAARDILNSPVGSTGLNDQQLRQRIRNAQRLRNSGRLSPQTARAIDRLLASHRRELKRRAEAGAPVPDPQLPSQAEQIGRQLVANSRAARKFTTPRLVERFRLMRQLIANPEVSERTRQGLRRLVREYANELRARGIDSGQGVDISGNEIKARRFLRNSRASHKLADGQLRRRAKIARSLLALPGLSGQTRQRLRNLIVQDERELARRVVEQPPPGPDDNELARRIIENYVAPARLPVRKLRRRVRRISALLDSPQLSPRNRRRLQVIAREYRAEIQDREYIPTLPQVSEGDRRANVLLNDRTPAASLNERQLKQRLAAIRTLLQEEEVSPRLSRRLRQRLAIAREELRRRIAKREAARAGVDAPLEATPRSVRDLLADRTPARALRIAALRARIRATRRALARSDLTRWQRIDLGDLLTGDRKELRARLIRRKERRRARLNAEVRNNRLRLERPAVARNNDVAAAETETSVLEGQLLAPPRRRVWRRYTLRDLRTRPELRDYMPAVDVDTIHFGFNEYFVREEEIDKIERLGEVIERIVAARPYEVFLIEGHTDAVGSDEYNLELSEKRAAAVKKALTTYFAISPDNLATIGYGEQFLKIPTSEEEPENRRVTVRRITPLVERQ